MIEKLPGAGKILTSKMVDKSISLEIHDEW